MRLRDFVLIVIPGLFPLSLWRGRAGDQESVAKHA